VNADRLLAQYHRIADAPDAIPRLRRFVLDLAVRGKLVPQDPREQPAKGFIGPRDPAVPFELPSNWRWARIGDQLELSNGMAFKPTDWVGSGLRIVRIQNLNNPEASFNFCNPAMARERSLIDDGTFLISWSGTPGTSFGAFIWDRGPAILNQHIFRCDFKTRAFTAPYLRLAINGRLDEMIEKAHGGVGLQHITKGKLEALLISLPPLAEQHRIVAKVDELMALCDRLEAARAEREAWRDRLAAASLARLNAPDPDPAAFADHARFTLNNLAALTTRPDQVKQLRQTILNLAVRGKLVPQAPNDETADTLLRRIGSGWSETVDDDDCEISRIPLGWEWALVEHCFNVTGGIQKTPARAPRNNAFPYLGVGNVYRGRLDLANVKQFELAEGELERFRLRSGDILIVEGNGSASEIGRCAIWNGEIENCVHQNHLIRCRPILSSLTPYAALYLNSPDGMAEMRRLSITSAGLFSLSVGKIRKIPLPLPPLAEQRRIVAKVDELMALCERLEPCLATSGDASRRLLDALFAEALAPATPLDLDLAS
jgi:type I restriction enzyme S subunit